MRTGSGNRSNYNRTTGSRTARLYSKRTAKRINKAYQNSQAKRIRNIQYTEEGWQDDYGKYDEYYDIPKSRKMKNNNIKRSTAIIAASLIVVVLALVIVGLSLLKPVDIKGIGLVQETVDNNSSNTGNPDNHSEDPSDAAQPETTTTFEESDPPVIYGVMPIVVYEGHSVAYKQGIYIKDDNDDNPTLEIENDDVDLSTPGTYIVTYVARDRNGNVTREATTLTVLEGKNVVSDDEIYALADSILDYIITEDEYTDELKCLKIYEYLHAINYVDEVHSEDWMQNAYWMLTLREGDCFCYYSAARLLLSRLGYDVMEVRNNNNYVHFWCLVSLDDGDTWWHFDPTCWSWGEDGILCLVSDDYLSEFTRRHRTGDGRLIHAWDRTNYPATPEYDFWTDEDRAIIYEGGLIELDPEYDPDSDIWDENNGWDYYPLSYYFEEYPELYTGELPSEEIIETDPVEEVPAEPQEWDTGYEEVIPDDYVYDETTYEYYQQDNDYSFYSELPPGYNAQEDYPAEEYVQEEYVQEDYAAEYPAET